MSAEPTTVKNLDLETTPIAELVAAHPQLEPVLNTFGLDTCCGGHFSPVDAAARHKIDAALLLKALREALGA